MPVSFNTNNALDLFYHSGGETIFPDSLRMVLNYAQDDDNIKNLKELAYLLATAKNEADYSLQRWEADFLCNSRGIPYDPYPCQSALNYYASDDGKSNYYLKGVDKYNLPYFGRGLIQLTNKYNYEKWGKKIGVDLVDEGDLALVPINSYKIASGFLKEKTFPYVNDGNLRQARISVNGGTKGLDDTNAEYDRWLWVLEQPNVNFKYSMWTKTNKIIAGVGLGATLLIGLYVLYKKN